MCLHINFTTKLYLSVYNIYNNSSAILKRHTELIFKGFNPRSP